MLPAFGFSVGDFISVINLIRKISKALKETGGASTEYQNAIIELKGLKHALQHLEALEPTDDNLSHVNAIRGMALACQLPLRDFMIKLEKYEASLGPWESRSSFRAAGRKARWAVSFATEVEKLRVVVAAKQLSLNLLLATHSSQTLSKMNSRTAREHGDLMSKVAEQRATVLHVQKQVETLKENMTEEGIATHARLDAISSDTNATQASVKSLRTLAEQITSYIRTFPQNVRDSLQAPMQSNWQMYQVPLQIQQSISRAPTSLHASNIRFTNALGEYRELPYEFFCHWEPFEGFLRSQFKGKPGETKVLDGQFYMIDTDNDERVIVKKEHWSRHISEGAGLGMSMIMSHLRRKSGSCPRPNCSGSETAEPCERAKVMTCRTCHLNFFPALDELEGNFGHISVLADDEEIARKQAMEDLQLYGSRLEPLNVIEDDEQSRFADLSLPPSQRSPGFDVAVDRPTKVRKESDTKMNYQAVTAFDWNSGSTPLESWLNQSAIPSASPTFEFESKEDVMMAKDPIAQEIEKIEVFRNIHISVTPEPSADTVNIAAIDQVAELELDAQIYYRNIVDRYPNLPLYLALRLARADRLRQNKAVRSTLNVSFDSLRLTSNDSPPGKIKAKPSHASRKKHKCDSCGKGFMRPSSLLTHMYSHRGEESKLDSCVQVLDPPKKEIACTGSKRRYSVISDMLHDRNMHEGYWSLSNALPPQTYTTGDEYCDPYDGQIVADSDFWTGGHPPRRRGSVHSRSSSMNSSLHGYAVFDPKDQEPAFYDKHSRSSSADFGERSRGLPPPPVELRQKISFECDICGNTVKVDRRRDWQRHVLEDLQPYICTLEECGSSTSTYASRRKYIQHEIIEHKLYPPLPLDDHPTSPHKPPIFFICGCCPKKPKKFDSLIGLSIHESERQYSCCYCSNRFKNRELAERHQNSVHLRKHSWSCAALNNSFESVFYPSTIISSPDNNSSQLQPQRPSSSLIACDTCAYCGVEFPNEPAPDWEARGVHLNDVHKFGMCNQFKKFFRADHFRQHLKHSHNGIIGEWTNKLEILGMRDEIGQQSQGASVIKTDMSASNIRRGKVYENTVCPFRGQKELHVEGSRRRHIERHMEEVAFAIVSKPYEEWDFYSDSSSNHSRHGEHNDGCTKF